MREELKTLFFTASPSYSTDAYNHKEISGYDNLKAYKGLVIETEEREVMDKFGYRPNFDLHIILDPEQAASCTIVVNDALYLTEPTAVSNLYPAPSYIIAAIRHFKNKISIDARKQID